MKKNAFLISVAVFFVYCLIILARYSFSYPEILPLPYFASFVFYTVGAKFLFISALALSAYGFGGTVFSRWLPDFGFLLEEALLKVFLGLIVVSYLVFFLGLAGLIYPLTGFAVLIAGLALGARDIKGFAVRMAGVPREFRLTLPFMVLLAVSLYFLIGGLYAAFLPPTGFDPLMYHLGVPKLYLDAHRIYPTPDVNGSAFPYGIEMLYLLGMMTEGVISANVVNYSFAVAGGLAALLFARRFVKDAYPSLAFAIYVSIPMVFWLMPQAYVELGMAAYTMLALHAMCAYFETKDRRWILAVALLAGFISAIKYNGVFMAAIFIAAIIVNAVLVDRGGVKQAFVLAGFLAAASAAIAAPWYIKNVFYYGNPVYPYLDNIFGHGKSVLEAAAPGYSSGSVAELALKHLSSVWRTTLSSGDYQANWSNGFGPVLLMFIPGILVVRGVERPVKFLLLFCLSFFLVMITLGNMRYLAPMLPALAVAASYPAGKLMSDRLPAMRAAGVAVVFVFAFSALLASTSLEKALSFPSSSPAAVSAFYSANQGGYLASYDTWQWINQNLPEDAVIYQLWDDASVYFRQRKTIGFPLPWGGTGRNELHRMNGVVGFDGFLPGEDIIANLNRMGATFLLINANREGHAIPEDPYFQAHAKLIRADKGVFLFQMVY